MPPTMYFVIFFVLFLTELCAYDMNFCRCSSFFSWQMCVFSRFFIIFAEL